MKNINSMNPERTEKTEKTGKTVRITFSNLDLAEQAAVRGLMLLISLRHIEKEALEGKPSGDKKPPRGILSDLEKGEREGALESLFRSSRTMHSALGEMGNPWNEPSGKRRHEDDDDIDPFDEMEDEDDEDAEDAEDADEDETSVTNEFLRKTAVMADSLGRCKLRPRVHVQGWLFRFHPGRHRQRCHELAHGGVGQVHPRDVGHAFHHR